jgi:hypothetical protein
MSSHAARGFVSTLRRVERALQTSIPERTRILSELEFDLEELQARLVAQGLEPEEARQRALESLVPDGRVLEQLDRLHQSAYRRLTSGLHGDQLRLLERALLVGMMAGVLGIQTVACLRLNLLSDPSPFLLPVLAMGVALFTLVLWKGFELWIKQDHARPRRGMKGILALSGLIVGTACGGTVLDFYSIAASLEATPELADPLLVEWVARDSALLAVAFLLALAGALAWLVLNQWLAWVSSAHRAVLGFDDFTN